MSETFEKRARAQHKKMKAKDKAERRQQRRETPDQQPAAEDVAARYYEQRDPAAPR